VTEPPAPNAVCARPAGESGRLGRILAARRSGLVVTFGVVLVVAILYARGVTADWVSAWRFLNVPASPPPFLDLHHVTDFLPCVRQGADVYRDASCDPLARPFNYPPVWLWLADLGIGAGATPALALAIEAAALAVLIALVSDRAARDGVFVLLALVSPSVAVGFERGNADLLVLALVGAAALLLGRARGWRQAAAASLLLAATALKLYPIAAAAGFARDRRWAACMLAFVAASLAYGMAIAAYLPLIQKNTFQIAGAYGATAILSTPIAEEFLAGFADRGGVLALEAAALLLAAAAGCAALAVSRRSADFCRIGAGAAGAAFQFGAAIYGLTFLLGANLAYRLAFLLLLLPQLFDWLAGPRPRTRGAALTLLALVEMACWLTIGTGWEELAAQAVHWVLFAGLAFVMACDLTRAVPGLFRCGAEPGR
jgi:hypothetical protein